MYQNKDLSGAKRKEVNQGLVLGVVVGQVGCLTLIIVLAALFGGLWLDNHFDTKPMITVGLMIASVPVTLIAMVWIVRRATARLQATTQKKDQDTSQGGNLQ
jgi:F0F1-type ATP synthase assembly protein I